MGRQCDQEYYASRASVERELSQTASDPVVAEVHAQLAEGYERLTRASRERARTCASSAPERVF